MAHIFITGSADGLGYLAARQLVQEGHQVVLHARSQQRGKVALDKVHGALTVLSADLADIEETKQLAADANSLGKFDAVIHNAGVYRTSGEWILKVNTIAPYILTCLMDKPGRLIYLSSGLHMSGDVNPTGFEHGNIRYADSKLHVILLAKAISRKWKEVFANSVDPGWVPTRMGGPGAPGNLEMGFQTQTWLAVSNDAEALVSGRYFYHKKEKHYSPIADDVEKQERFLKLCEQVTGVRFPQ